MTNHFPTSDSIEPYGSRILVRKYRKPEKIGSILLNPAWLVDNSRALWEVIKVAPCKCTKKQPNKCPNCYLGLEIEPDWILITLPNRGTHIPLWDQEEMYFLFAEEVVKYIVKDW